MSDPVPTAAAFPQPSPEELKAFHDAARQGDTGTVREFLDKHGNGLVEEEDGAGTSPLFLAALYNRCDTVVLLLDRGADVNRRGNFARTALMRAAIGDHLDVVILLLDRGADIEAKDNENITALMFAERYDRAEIISFLRQWSETKNQREAEKKKQQEEDDAARAAAAAVESRLEKLKHLRPAKPALRKPHL